jgi:myo-inositol-1(or 4)-monophosphatase
MSTLGSTELRELADIARDAARAAGVVVARGWRKRPEAEHKGRVDLVTSFDRESEELLRDRLAKETRFAFVGEEGGGLASDAPTWFVDPLDGTTNFVHGHPFYCVSVGLARAGAALVGAVVAPALAVEWVGVAEGTSTRNGEPCVVSETSRISDALLATGFPYDRATSTENNFEAFVAMKKKCRGVRRCGAAAIDLCFVADGTYDGYWERKLQAWDLAAGAAIVLGAGGRLSRYGGADADVTSHEMIATNGRIHDALVAELDRVEGRA